MAEVANVKQSSLDALSSREVSERVKRGDYILKKKKKTKVAVRGKSLEQFMMKAMVRRCLAMLAMLFVRLVCVTKSL